MSVFRVTSVIDHMGIKDKPNLMSEMMKIVIEWLVSSKAWLELETARLRLEAEKTIWETENSVFSTETGSYDWEFTEEWV